MVIDYLVMPKNILENNKKITLSIDIMFVNKILFVTTISRHIKFTTVEDIQKSTKSQLSECIKNVIAIYTQRGFKVEHALLDREFVPRRTDLCKYVWVLCRLIVVRNGILLTNIMSMLRVIFCYFPGYFWA